MIDLFRRKKPEDISRHITLVKSVLNELPAQYFSLKQQVEEGIIKGVNKLDQPFVNYNKFLLDTDVLNKYEDKAGRFFILKGASVYDIDREKYQPIWLIVVCGVLLGYSMPNGELITPDFSNIKVNLYKQYLGEGEFNRIKSTFDSKEQKLLNPAEVYNVEINGKNYIHIKGLENGDFLAIDRDKRIYRVTHDPYGVDELKGSLKDIL